MEIRGYGEVVLCRNITFEDNKYDTEKGHPGVVVLPTNENDDNVCCLYMTTNKERARIEKEKYTKYTGQSEKDSYVNLQHIVKEKNNKDREIDKLDDEKFLDLLEKFYNFQINLTPHKESFLEIKNKIEILIDLLKINKQFKINEEITSKLLEDFEKIHNKQKRERIYKSKLCISHNINTKKLFSDEKERIYNEKLISLYNKLKNINFDALDFNNLNNELRREYMNFREKNFLLNANSVFLDVVFLFNDDIKHKVYEFIEIENNRTQIREQNRIKKIETKQNSNKKNRINKAISKANEKKRREEKRYGKSEFFK